MDFHLTGIPKSAYKNTSQHVQGLTVVYNGPFTVVMLMMWGFDQNMHKVLGCFIITNFG